MSERVSMNPAWTGPDLAAPKPDTGEVAAFHASLPGFSPTPLVELPRLAAGLGLRRLFVKHERERLGLPSFKVVGAAWAVNRAIAERLDASVPPRFAATAEAARSLPAGTTLTTATDGNHGRAVAHLARLLGLACRIYVPEGMAPGRVAAIEAEGASVVPVEGPYDDAVRRSAADAREDARHLLVSDTSWPGYETIPSAVVAGYGTIFREARAQLAEATCEDAGFALAVVPAGVGAVASAAVRHLADGHGCDVVTAEPLGADCVRRSLAAGRLVTVPGPHESIMAGLNCGEVSRVAWPVLRRGVRAAVAVSDDEARTAMRRLAAEGVASGASGAAGIAGLAVLAQEGFLPAGGGPVLVLGTEGVTDPGAYRSIVVG
ncbi:diaminopropionate ammonia-lyase [Actinomadura sp. DC4]|uniref:diaminopropionate ammonia-lyase n=1 Tax=Actinomadura sp. DC4 TaxID=3055069 RepID=UPI0025B0FA76|nr:diaminopropionate ammonia-lyase [Actinomadura sp. DC4]MDN3353654.1 diaminopropionate ammonia-lyase [Actinomadura sp. DC4]